MPPPPPPHAPPQMPPTHASLPIVQPPPHGFHDNPLSVNPPRGSEDAETLQRTIRISNLSPSLKVKKLLKDLTQEFGEVGRYSVEMDASTQAPVAIVEFLSAGAGLKAVSAGQLGSLKLTSSPTCCVNGEAP